MLGTTQSGVEDPAWPAPTHGPLRATPPRATWLVLPLLLVLVVGGTWTLLGRDLPRPVASGLPLLAAIIAILGLERLLPLHQAWNRQPDGTDLLLLIVNRGVDLAVVGGTVLMVATWGDTWSGTAWWPTTWPVPVQIIGGIVLGESIRYALHRLSHRPGLWWRVHRTHHAPARMYALNGPRLHPLNYLWASAAHTVPMLVLGAPLEIVLVVINVTGLFVVFQHANLALHFGGMNRFFATPDVHRIHHAHEIAGHGANFAIILLIFDRLFGTYEPAGAAVAADGIGLTAPKHN